MPRDGLALRIWKDGKRSADEKRWGNDQGQSWKNASLRLHKGGTGMVKIGKSSR
jgi:hypothetical protein